MVGIQMRCPRNTPLSGKLRYSGVSAVGAPCAETEGTITNAGAVTAVRLCGRVELVLCHVNAQNIVYG